MPKPAPHIASNTRPLRVVFFGNAAPNIAAIRYRVIKFAEMLVADGAQCTVCLPSSFTAWQILWESGGPIRKILYLLLNILTRIAQLRHVPGADAVIFRGPLIYSGYGPPWLERLCHMLNPNLIYDIDDAVWAKPDGVDSLFQRFVDLAWLWKVAPLCKHGIVGNEYLAAQVAGRSPETTIIPTCIDMQKHTQKTYPHSGVAELALPPVTLGWTGLYTNLVNLQPIEPVLQQLARKHPIKLLVATGRPYHLEGAEVENHHWQADQEITYLQSPDIGLMPLLDTPSTRGKCAFKALQYMGVGTPCVISPVGMNADIIQDGIDGFLANTPAEWHDRLEQLILDPALRESMGRAARETIHTRYSHEAYYPALRGVIEKVAGRTI